jgi:hypothetical protein
MNDTSLDIEARVARMMASKTPRERLRMASSMFDTGRMLVEAGLRNKYGELTEAQIRGRVFVRMYGEDFSDEEIRKIAGKIPKMELE